MMVPANTIIKEAVGDLVNEEPMLKYFEFSHLPPHLQSISKEFAGLAIFMVVNLTRCPERTAGLRKLLEAKDCAVRAALEDK